MNAIAIFGVSTLAITANNVACQQCDRLNYAKYIRRSIRRGMRKTQARYGETNHQGVPDSDQDRRPNERVINEPYQKFRHRLTPPIRV
ncbi:hypothetical protein P5V15_000728 [Pogonomyrmex californicus]